jgi:hypothetical protein
VVESADAAVPAFPPLEVDVETEAEAEAEVEVEVRVEVELSASVSGAATVVASADILKAAGPLSGGDGNAPPVARPEAAATDPTGDGGDPISITPAAPSPTAVPPDAPVDAAPPGA